MGTKNKRLIFCIHSLQAGGMERVCWQLLHYVSEHTFFEVYLVLYGKQPEFFYQVPKKVVVLVPQYKFDDSKRISSTLRRMYWLRQKVNGIAPHYVVSFGEYWNTLVLIALIGTKHKTFVSDRSQPDKSLGTVQDFLRRIFYPQAHVVIAQTEKALSIYKTLYKANKWSVLGNPIRSIPCKGTERRKEILMVARFIRSKHQDQLIRIFSKLNAPDWKLVLVGDDHLKQHNRAKWEALADELGIKNRVMFEGKRSNVEDYYCRASIFAFTSSSEGFPNVIGEAQSAGLPVVAYDCVAGPSELIKDNENGFLIPLFNENLFAQRLQILVDSPELRLQFSRCASDAVNKFSVTSVGKRFVEILTSP